MDFEAFVFRIERCRKYRLQKEEKYKHGKGTGVEPVSLVSKGISFILTEKLDLEMSAFNKRGVGCQQES